MKKVSNTKSMDILGRTKEEMKRDIKQFLRDNKNAYFTVSEDLRMVCLCNTAFIKADTVKISTAIASKTEKKFKPLVGMGLAIERMDMGEFIVYPKNLVTRLNTLWDIYYINYSLHYGMLN